MPMPKDPIKAQVLREKMRQSQLGESNNFFGKHHSGESKRKISLAKTGQKQSTEAVQRRVEAKRKRVSTQGYSDAELKRNEEFRKVNIGRKHSLKRRRIESLAHIGTKVKLTPEGRKRKRESMLGNRYWMAGGKRPNGAEQTLLNILQRHFPNQWKYCGDFSFIIGGKNPDFVNVNGKKQLIELFGVYWHDVFDISKRTDHFRQYGFSTLIIWEDELRDKTVLLKKIRRFAKTPTYS